MSIFDRKYQHIRKWESDDESSFRLEIYDTNKQDRFGRIILVYEFFHKDKLIVCGKMKKQKGYNIDDNETVSEILSDILYRRNFFNKLTYRHSKLLKESSEILEDYVDEMAVCC